MSGYKPGVLVVDDDPDVLAAMAHMLQTRGFRVLTAGEGDTAVALCQQHGDIDVLVADLSLPGDLNGNLARRVTAIHPHIKVVFATGVPRTIALAMGLVQPQAPYLEKPVSPDILESAIRLSLTSPR
ncbi:response regulator [Actinoplanes sp. NPDC048796]|uniref:response regulator n=1 Tax=unclassified Actinoplanes TaxID=2626549 RepID=UPI0033CE41F9